MCQKCGSPASQIPPKAEWGTQVTSQKTGKKYFVFLKCDNCNWSLSSDPKPRRYSQKPQGSPNQANSNDLKEVLDEEERPKVSDLDNYSLIIVRAPWV